MFGDCCFLCAGLILSLTKAITLMYMDKIDREQRNTSMHDSYAHLELGFTNQSTACSKVYLGKWQRNHKSSALDFLSTAKWCIPCKKKECLHTQTSFWGAPVACLYATPFLIYYLSVVRCTRSSNSGPDWRILLYSSDCKCPFQIISKTIV